MGFGSTTLRDLFGCSNHWATGDSVARKGKMWVASSPQSLQQLSGESIRIDLGGSWVQIPSGARIFPSSQWVPSAISFHIYHSHICTLECCDRSWVLWSKITSTLKKLHSKVKSLRSEEMFKHWKYYTRVLKEKVSHGWNRSVCWRVN